MKHDGQDLPRSAVVTYSGGMDSTTLLYWLLDQGVEVAGALSVDYGQKHRKELDAARAFCDRLGIQHRVADLSSLAVLFGGSSLTDRSRAVPQGHYAEANMKSTVVPNRNMLLLAVAASWAVSLKADCVAYAAHSGDHAIYPDCREEFAAALDAAVRLCDWHPLRLYRPFVSLTKAEIVRVGSDLGVPFAETWSCYRGGALHCGRCGTCVERREAFFLAGQADRTRYDAEAPSVAALARSSWKL